MGAYTTIEGVFLGKGEKWDGSCKKRWGQMPCVCLFLRETMSEGSWERSKRERRTGSSGEKGGLPGLCLGDLRGGICAYIERAAFAGSRAR